MKYIDQDMCKFILIFKTYWTNQKLIKVIRSMFFTEFSMTTLLPRDKAKVSMPNCYGFIVV